MKIGDNLKVKLGYDWSLICECNKFAGGDVVRFKFDTDFRCHLFKSGKCWWALYQLCTLVLKLWLLCMCVLGKYSSYVRYYNY
jgi:hypothetical protein